VVRPDQHLLHAKLLAGEFEVSRLLAQERAVETDRVPLGADVDGQVAALDRLQERGLVAEVAGQLVRGRLRGGAGRGRRGHVGGRLAARAEEVTAREKAKAGTQKATGKPAAIGSGRHFAFFLLPFRITPNPTPGTPRRGPRPSRPRRAAGLPART